MARAHATTDHDKIRQWAEKRDGHAGEKADPFCEVIFLDLAGPEDEDDEDDDDDEDEDEDEEDDDDDED